MGYLMHPKDNYINNFFFKMNQMPDRWFYKAYRLFKDASILYEASEKERSLIYKKLKKKGYFKYNDSRALKRYIYDILEENPDIDLPDFRSFYLLAGFCIENALKGIIISQNIELIDCEKLNKNIKSHDLKKLLKHTNLKLNEEHLIFFEKISDLVSSYGRYPTRISCLKSSELGRYETGDIDSFGASCNCVTNPYKQDMQIFKSIYKNLKKQMVKEEKKYDRHMNFVFNEEIKASL